MRKLLLTTGTLVAILAAGVAQAQDKLIVAIYKSGTQQYFIDQAAGFTAAAKELGYEARIINVDASVIVRIDVQSSSAAAAAASASSQFLLFQWQNRWYDRYWYGRIIIIIHVPHRFVWYRLSSEFSTATESSLLSFSTTATATAHGVTY